MLLVLVAGLLAGSLLVLLIKRTRETLLMSAVCLTLTIFLAGVMILISKQGGISRELERALFFSHAVRVWLQYRFITLNQLGLVVSVDRMERGQKEKSALQEIRETYGLKTAAIVTMAEVVEHLYNRPYKGSVIMDDALKAAIDAYYEQYGVR